MVVIDHLIEALILISTWLPSYLVIMIS